jgi:serine/threonine protein phosphatase PrpC
VKYFKNFFETNSQLIKGKTETDIYNLLLYSNYKLIRDAIQECEKKLSNEEDININSSGSTLCMIIQIYQKIICVNVGDSRAILSISEILRDEIKILSIDHKPSLKKEQERIKNCGGFVKSIDSNGQLRVWDSPILKSPGLALSRSIGDLDAAKIGVIAEPDFWMKSVKKEMNFIVIASDGIWEFLSNKEVCDIVKKFYLNGNPKEAAEELVKKAREIWEKKGKEIDDITTIIIFL